MENNMSDYLIHSGKLGMHWYQHDKDAYQTKSGNWVYGRNKPSESRGLKAAKTDGKTISIDGKKGASDIPDILDDAVKINLVGKNAKYSPSRNQNCISCAIAYDLRRAGNKVQAIETAELISPFVIADIYKKTKITDYVISAKRFGTGKSSTVGMTDSEFDNMVNHLKSAGENSRGIMTVDWKYKHSAWYGVDDYAGCHAMNYEVKNGKFYLIDGQLGKVYDEQNARKLLSNTHDVKTLRTDNRRVNLDYAKSYFVEPEGTKITAPSKDLHTAEVVGKISKGLYKASPVAAAASIGLLAIHPALFVGGLLTSTAMGIGGNAARTKFSYKAQEIIRNNKDKTAAKIIEKLTGDKVDPKTLSTTVAKAMRSLPEYKRVYQAESGGKYIDYPKVLSSLKTTDGDNTTNRNRAKIPVALPTGRNTNVGVSSSKKGSMKSLYAKGVPIDEIAEKLGVSPSTVSKYVK
jgi:hypothetical protein